MGARTAFEEWVEANGRDPEFFFVQIGANDGRSLGGTPGVTDDPIFEYVHTYRWSGLLVEPIPYLFDRLRSGVFVHTIRRWLGIIRIH